MDTADLSPSNSKVIIQCTDPSNVFESLEPRLSAKSPLKNLHWKSPTRPLRSIPNLNISVTREDKSGASTQNVRRHQIPGLRETPYVKLYLLRCDDKERYKESARKEVRQWVKSNTSPSDSKSSTKINEKHDAFEWLIVHVVLPNTPAASQPRSSKNIPPGATDSTDSVNSKSAWTGKSHSTILDKLKADFNSSSKSAFNRVVQVRLLETGDKSSPLSPADIEGQWQDLVEALKACILRSFDARVLQYESDIRERDAQRTLPGWNFCTFFVLKEGLAMGFENVGLLDDSLAVYDELSLGLDALVQDEAENADPDDHGALLRFSKDSKSLLRTALEEDGQGASPNDQDEDWSLSRLLAVDRAMFPFVGNRQRYRNLILANQVSALDLRIYLFTRQMEILLRHGKADTTKLQGSNKSGANLSTIAEVAERGVRFINLAARTLRSELYDAWGGQEGLSDAELHHQSTVTGNIVSSWVWTATVQILSEVLPSLGIDLHHWTNSLSIDTLELSQNAGPGSTGSDLEAGNYIRRLSFTSNLRSPSRDRSSDRSNRHSMLTNGTTPLQLLLSRAGSQRILLWTSRLVLLARQTMQNLEAVKCWNQILLGNNPMEQLETSKTKIRISVDQRDDEHDMIVRPHEHMTGLDSNCLKAAARSKNTFFDLYILLTVLAYRLFGHAKSYAGLQQVLIDLVRFEYLQQNYTIAARYLSSVLGPMPRQAYKPTDIDLIQLYAECLQYLDKPNDQIKCLMACLQSVPGANLSRSTDGSTSNQDMADHLFRLSRTIAPINVPLTHLFAITSVASTISHTSGRDGFSLALEMKTIWGSDTPSTLDEMKLRIASKNTGEPRFLTLYAEEAVQVRGSATKIVLTAPVVTYGWYTLEEMEIQLGNLRLLHHFPSVEENESLRLDETVQTPASGVPILVYPNFESLSVRVRSAARIHLAQNRRLCIEILSGHNNVKQCRIRLKTATAGLRLNIHDSVLLDGDKPSHCLRTAREGDTLMMMVDELEPQTCTMVELPYTIEVQSEAAISIRIDATYETDSGTFHLYDVVTINVLLPLAVNVQDVYRPGQTYSRFAFSPVTMVPLRLIDCKLEENEYYSIEQVRNMRGAVTVFPRQPAHWTVGLIPKDGDATRSSRTLTLAVRFQSLDEVILEVLEEHFASALEAAGFANVSRLLVPHLTRSIRGRWTEQDLEVTGLTNEVEMWRFDDLDWHNVLCGIERDSRPGIESWLAHWHSSASAMSISNILLCQREIRLHVDVPRYPVIVCAVLHIGTSDNRGRVASVGQPALAELELKAEGGEDDELEATFELVTVADTWLIGGRRKGNIKLGPESCRIQVVLFPQQTGHLMLPTVTVKCRRKAMDPKTKRESWTEVNSEVYNVSQGRSVFVSSDLQSATVEVFEAIPTKAGGRLIACKPR
ncbi:hypothetical protein PV10_09187 [Exophiala mesophila]|uniref:Trafficking protein particle complex subunit 11 domain-containing protein n=1 Tax=Exophiala mesophila TaxID=212818 RepID=A0A0D1WGX6_EXOME|nr:uncharacterized protein PV10_09187 [Exophiala mesophila]KIV88010.1 hypothetical protein PV10_09187 [Exophiala mesophila]